MGTNAYFISPAGHVMLVETSHIATLIESPRAFGTTKRKIEAVYANHKESLGHEGYAREEILVEVIRRGWIRIREYPDEYWSVQFAKATPRTKTFIRKWARAVLRRRIAKDPYLPVQLVGFSDGFTRRVELKALANTGMLEVRGAERWRSRWGNPAGSAGWPGADA